MGEIVGVTQIDDTVYNGGTTGPMTERLAACYRELTENEGYPISPPARGDG